MPSDTPSGFFKACEMFGADTHRVDGNISDCAKAMKSAGGTWTDLSTTKEPYRVEGKKTLAFEMAEQLNWVWPDAVVCPTGGGTAIVGTWKGVDELRSVGLVVSNRPRLYAVQSSSCAPVVRAFEEGLSSVEAWSDPQTYALGLRVPKPFAGKLILRAIRQSEGSAIAVGEQEIQEMQRLASRMEGIEFGPESAAGLAGLRRLVETGEVSSDEQVVVLNTGTVSRYWT
jgi:threonine synthase